MRVIGEADENPAAAEARDAARHTDVALVAGASFVAVLALVAFTAAHEVVAGTTDIERTPAPFAASLALWVAWLVMSIVFARKTTSPLAAVPVAIGAAALLFASVGWGSAAVAAETTGRTFVGEAPLFAFEPSLPLLVVGTIAGFSAAGVAASRLSTQRRRTAANLTWAATWFALLAWWLVAWFVFTSTLNASEDGRPLRRTGRRHRHPVASGWTRAAHHEWAAAFAFEQVARQLDLVGAPGGLVGRCRAAADDERRHADLCLVLAAHDGETATDLPDHPSADVLRSVTGRQRRLLLRLLAREAQVDGVENEGRAAQSLRVRADDRRRAGDAWAATTIGTIAADEERHVLLNADIVTWCTDARR